MEKAVQGKIKSIEIALNNELHERDFYLQHSSKTINALGKKMFATIADDEQEHYLRLKQLHKELSQTGKWPETLTLTLKMKKLNLKDMLKNVVNNLKKSPPADIDDKEAVKIAIDFEDKGYRFYRDLMESASNEQERNFFSSLADIEREHLLSLKETLLFFEDPSTWFEEKEKPHIDGG